MSGDAVSLTRRLIEAGKGMELLGKLAVAIESRGGDERDLEIALNSSLVSSKIVDDIILEGAKERGYPVRVRDQGAVNFSDFLKHCGIQNQSECLRNLLLTPSST